ncbi:MAG: TIGR04282 family arsenosugar biosynthesis glycosyltransferase [Planctomycetota bacterium]
MLLEEAILVFLRHPEPGKAKTRLIPALGAEGAATLYRRMAERVAGVVRTLDRPGLDRIAYFEPAEREAEIADWMGPAFRVVPQPETGLGGRLEAGFAAAFESGARRVIALGSDCVEITPALLAEALDALREADAVVGPARDGGYWTVGLSRPFPDLFRDIPWSTGEVLTRSRAKLEAAGLTVRILPELADVDRPEDLDRVADLLDR